MASAPMVVTESPRWPAIIVLTIPIMGTVMLDIMLGSAMRRISRFIFSGGRNFIRLTNANIAKKLFFWAVSVADSVFCKEMEHKLFVYRKFRLPLQPQITVKIMKNTKQDSMSAVSRFGRDKRNRVTNAEHIERSPRPRRDADSEGRTTFGRKDAGHRAS